MKIKKIRERKSKWLSRFFEKSIDIRLGPAALPIGNDFKVSWSSLGVTMIESSLYVVFFTVARLSANRVFTVKLFKIFALPFPQ